MSLERLFALNWPNKYIRVVTKGRTKKVSVAIVIGSLLPFIMVRIVGCYAQGEVLYCPTLGSSYFLVINVSLLLVSTVSFIKIYTIVCKQSTGRITESRGTVAAFLLYLMNSVIAMTIYLGIAMYNKFRVTTEDKIQSTYQIVNVIDLFTYLTVSLIHCCIPYGSKNCVLRF